MRAQYAIFHSKDGIFGLPAAKVDAVTMSPIKWWSTYGSETPELAEIAIKFLHNPLAHHLQRGIGVHIHLSIMSKETGLTQNVQINLSLFIQIFAFYHA